MKSKTGDVAVLAVLKYLDDLTVKMSGDKVNVKRKNITIKLKDLNFDIYRLLHGRHNRRAIIYSLVDWRFIRLSSATTLISDYLKSPDKVEISPEAHSQILKWVQGVTNQPLNVLIAANISLSIEKIILQGRKMQPLHISNLM